jgi:hypothetical protein
MTQLIYQKSIDPEPNLIGASNKSIIKINQIGFFSDQMAKKGKTIKNCNANLMKSEIDRKQEIYFKEIWLI